MGSRFGHALHGHGWPEGQRRSQDRHRHAGTQAATRSRSGGSGRLATRRPGGGLRRTSIAGRVLFQWKPHTRHRRPTSNTSARLASVLTLTT